MINSYYYLNVTCSHEIRKNKLVTIVSFKEIAVALIVNIVNDKDLEGK